MSHIRRIGLLAAAAVLTVGLAACGDDDSGGAAADTEKSTSTSRPDADTVEVELQDFKFVGLPETAKVGTKLAVVNTSERELHEMVVLKLKDGETRTLEELQALPDEEFEALVDGPPEMVLIARPDSDEQIEAVGDGTLKRAGRFVVICAIPTGVDPDEFFAAAEAAEDGPPQIEGAGPPHLVHGMVAELTVE